MEYLGAFLGTGAICFIIGYGIGRLKRYWEEGE